MKNLEIREAIEKNNLKYWEVADKIGVVGATFSVWLRHELPEEKKQTIFKAINTLILEKKGA